MNFKKIWDFIWHDDSFASWIVNVLIAFVVVKFLIYPGLGYILDTPFPIVAVVSGSMEHSSSLDKWWLEKPETQELLKRCKEGTLETIDFDEVLNECAANV